MQRDENRLREMLDAASQLTVLLTRSDAELQLLQDRVFRHSVFFEFVALGEQVAGLSSEFIGRHPEIP